MIIVLHEERPDRYHKPKRKSHHFLPKMEKNSVKKNRKIATVCSRHREATEDSLRSEQLQYSHSQRHLAS